MKRRSEDGDGGQKKTINREKKTGPFRIQKLRNFVWRQGKIKGIQMSQRARKKGRLFNMITFTEAIAKQIKLFQIGGPKIPLSSILKM